MPKLPTMPTEKGHTATQRAEMTFPCHNAYKREELQLSPGSLTLSLHYPGFK